MAGRDPNTGRFLPGNTLSAGNRGNTAPKWGNKNARKHGLFETLIMPKIDDDGWLRLIRSGGAQIRIHPNAWYREDGWFFIRNDIAEQLQVQGWAPVKC